MALTAAEKRRLQEELERALRRYEELSIVIAYLRRRLGE